MGILNSYIHILILRTNFTLIKLTDMQKQRIFMYKKIKIKITFESKSPLHHCPNELMFKKFIQIKNVQQIIKTKFLAL